MNNKKLILRAISLMRSAEENSISFPRISVNCTIQKRLLTADQVKVEQPLNTSLARITIVLQAGTQVPVS